MAQKNAQQLVNGLRYLVKNVGTEPYYDGFDSSQNPNGTLIPLLWFVNKAYQDYALAGFLQIDTDITLQSGVQEYALPVNVGEIKSVTIFQGSGSYPSHPVTMPQLARRFPPNWRARGVGSPYLHYTQGGIIGFSRTPNFSGIARLRSSAVPFDMAFPTSIPSGVPVMHQPALEQLGAIYYCGSDADDPQMAERANLLASQFIANFPSLRSLVETRTLDRNKAPLGVLAGQTNAGGDE